MKDTVKTDFRLGFHLNICLYLSTLKTGQEKIRYCIKNGTEEYIDMLTLPCTECQGFCFLKYACIAFFSYLPRWLWKEHIDYTYKKILGFICIWKNQQKGKRKFLELQKFEGIFKNSGAQTSKTSQDLYE